MMNDVPTPMTIPQANRIDPRIGVIEDRDASGNWWVYQRRNQRCARSLPPMTREEFKALLQHWFPSPDPKR